MKRIGFTLLTAFIGGAVAIGGYKLVESKYADGLSLDEKQKVYFTNNPTEVVSSTGNLDFTQAAAVVTPGVVHIKTTYKATAARGGDAMEDIFGDIFGGGGGRRMQAQPAMASGSGVIVSPDGYIVTNNHVVEDASDITVILPDKRSFKASVVGRDPNTDLALVKVAGNNLPVVKMGNSDNVRVGEWVLAVGYPFALETTVTAGIVSAKARSIGILSQQQRPRYGNRNNQETEPQASSAIESFIQTDAAINRGNSGGALVNATGELIGINAAIASQSGNYEGYGFAIPINLAKKIMDDFMKYGTVKRGYIGVSFDDLNAEKAETYGTKEINGLYVKSVVPGSGAAAAGIKEGDVIVKADDNNIFSSADLQERIGRLRPGDKVKITYLRGGKEVNANITLKGEDQVNFASANGNAPAKEIMTKLGATFVPAGADVKQRFNLNSGVVVSQVKPGGLFDYNEIPRGIIITSINGKPVSQSADVSSALALAKNGMITLNALSTDGTRMRIQFPVPTE